MNTVVDKIPSCKQLNRSDVAGVDFSVLVSVGSYKQVGTHLLMFISNVRFCSVRDAMQNDKRPFPDCVLERH